MTGCIRRQAFFLLISFFPFCGLLSQRVSFLLLQSEEKKPFYVKRDNKIFSSTASGYLILSKLPENDLVFQLGFPGSNQSESVFRVSLSKGEKGYLIKSFGDKGLGLFDIQDATVIYATTTSVTDKKEDLPVVAAPADDGFVNLLSGVTGDTTVKYITYVKKELPPISFPERKDSVRKDNPVSPHPIKDNTVAEIKVVERMDSPVVNKAEVPKPEIKTPDKETIIKTREILSKSEISLLTKSEAPETIVLIYTVSAPGNRIDTVDVQLVKEANGHIEEVKNPSVEKSDQKEVPVAPNSIVIAPVSNTDSVVQKAPVESEKSLDKSLSVSDSLSNQKAALVDSVNMFIPGKDSVTDVAVQDSAAESNKKKDSIVHVIQQEPNNVLVLDSVSSPKSSVIPNTTCRKAATEEDFIKLRRKMAQQSKDEEMLVEAEKFFRNVCFTTQQIRSLGSLFLKEEWRYRFYDAAMKYVLDFDHFSTLENTLESPYYKKRFLALIPQ